MSDADFLPLSSSFVQLIHVESIEVAQHHTVSTRVHTPTREVSAFLVIAIVESLYSIA